MNTFIYILTTVVEISSIICLSFMWTWTVYKILTPKKPGKFLRLSTIILQLALFITLESIGLIKEHDYYIFINHIGPFIPLFIYCVLVLKGSTFKKLLVSIACVLIYYTISIAFVAFWMLFGFSIKAMHESNLIYICTIIIVHSLSLAAYILFIKGYKKLSIKLKEFEVLQIAIIFVLTFVFLLVSINTTYIINDTRISIFILLTTICLIAMNIVTYFMIIKISKNNHIEQENALLRMEKEYQKKKYEDTIRQSEQIKKLRHDYKNNLLVIRSLAEDNNSEKVAEFVSQGIEQINATKMHVETNNEIVNAIVNTKMSAAAEQGIKVSFMSISDFDGIDDFDLCNLISNLFDNAITAVSSCENKIIEINIIKKDDLYTIKMSNTISESVIETNPELATTKEDNIYHGYGTKIIKDIADKYNGELDYYEEDGMFNFLVHLASKQSIISAVPV